MWFPIPKNLPCSKVRTLISNFTLDGVLNQFNPHHNLAHDSPNNFNIIYSKTQSSLS